MKPQVRINDSHEEMNPEMSPDIGRRKKYNYANDLVKIQACASLHMPADQRRRRGGVEYQLLCKVALWSFYLQFLPAECPKIDVDSILNKLLQAA